MTYHITPEDFNAEQRAALRKHGYNDNLAPCGVAGGPNRIYGVHDHPLRSRVCFLDGIEIDGHEASDLDNELRCIHCGSTNRSEWYGDDE